MALSEEMRLAIRLTAQDSTKQAFGQLNQSLDGLKRTALTAAAAIGSALAFREVISATQRLGDEVDLLRDNLGLSAKQASAWNVIARITGTSAEEIAQAMGALNRKLIDQIPLMDEGKDDFTKWGVAVRDASGAMLPLDVVVGNVRDKLRSLPPGLDRSGAAMDLLGRSGRQLIDFFTIGDARAKKFLDSARELGAILSEEETDAIEEFSQEMRSLGVGFDAIKARIGLELIPVFKSFVGWLRQNIGIIKSFGEALRYPLGILKEVIERLGKFVTDIKTIGWAAAIENLIKDFILKMQEVLPKFGEELDKMGVIGWAIKLIVASAAISWGLGVAGGLLGGVLSLLSSGARFMAFGLGAGATPITATLALGLILVIATASLTPQGQDMFGGIFKNPALWAGLLGIAAVSGFRLAMLLGAATPLSLAVGLGVVIGLEEMRLISEGAELSVLRDPGFWLRSLGLAGLVGVALSMTGAGTLFTLTVGAALAIQLLGPQILPPGGGNRGFGPFPGGAPPRFEGGPSGEGPNLGPELVKIGESAGGEMGIFFNPATGQNQFIPLVQAAHGGVFTRPTPALIGEDGPEAVIPLSRMGGVGGITINVYGDVDSRERVRELANQVSDQIMRAYTLAGNYRISRGGLA